MTDLLLGFSDFVRGLAEGAPAALVWLALAPGLLLALAGTLLRRPATPSAPSARELPPAGVPTSSDGRAVAQAGAAPAAGEAAVAGPAPVEAPPAPEPGAPAIPEPAPPPPSAPPRPGAAPVEEPSAPVAPAPEAPRVPLRERLARTRSALFGRLESVVAGRRLDAEVLEDLEALLFSADLGVETAESLVERVRKQAAGGDAAALRAVLREALLEKLVRVEAPAPPLAGPPHVILVVGVNGSGKTTTIGKLAARFTAEDHRVIVGAGDTFRAAATEQLRAWAERAGCELVAGAPGGDPAAVAYDTLKAARARGADVAIVDTAGRLQTRKPLMEELGKIARVMGREVEGAPHETLLVLDANTGQNALSQARLFTEVTGVTGLVLTKLDGTAKGGVLVGLADEFGIPVRFVGVGEAVEDLREFRAAEFVDALVEEGGSGGGGA